MPQAASSAMPIRSGRNPISRLYPKYVDAVEGVNATHTSPASLAHFNPAFNERALAYGREHGLPFTAGSDQHRTKMIGGGMVFLRPLADIHDFCAAVLAGEAAELLDGMRPPAELS